MTDDDNDDDDDDADEAPLSMMPSTAPVNSNICRVRNDAVCSS